jgi:hypothetical protein
VTPTQTQPVTVYINACCDAVGQSGDFVNFTIFASSSSGSYGTNSVNVTTNVTVEIQVVDGVFDEIGFPTINNGTSSVSGIATVGTGEPVISLDILSISPSSGPGQIYVFGSTQVGCP